MACGNVSLMTGLIDAATKYALMPKALSVSWTIGRTGPASDPRFEPLPASRQLELDSDVMTLYHVS